MKSVLNECIEKIQRSRRNYRRYLAFFLVLAMVTTLGVNWGLHQNGVSMSDSSEYKCGYAEHQHTDDCYTKTLTCGQEETEGSAGHTHTDACYQEQTVLVCTQAEHQHGEGCYDENGNLICQTPEHVHGDSCYTTESVLICGQEESAAVPAHHHTDACYTKELTCTIPEHTHTVECLSDKTADLETASVWEASIPTDLTGDWAEDLVKVAKSQIGYKESSENFKVEEDGTIRKGYSRYGAWYGNDKEYADWTALFVDFCLSYANISTSSVPQNADLSAWISDLTNAGLYKGTDYIPEKGDIVFLDTNSDGTIDHAGIIESVSAEESGSVSSFKAIVGDSSNEVMLNSYSIGEAKAFAELPENPAAAKSEDPTPTPEETNASEEETESEEINALSYDSGIALVDITPEGEDEEADDQSNNEIMPAAENGTGINMGDYITNVSFQKKDGVGWKESDTFTTADQVRATMNFENMYTSEIKDNNNTIYIDLPAYIDCSRFTGTYETYDGSVKSGTYTYQKNADGTYRIVLKLDDDYVNNAGDVIGGSLQFNFLWTKDAVDDSGSKKVEIGKWSGDVKVTEDNSGKEDTSSANYHIQKSAGSLYYSEDGKTAYIDYTITLTVKNEMTAPINIKDVLTGENFTYDTAYGVKATDSSGNSISANYGTTSGQGTDTQIQLWSGAKGTYTLKYRVKTLPAIDVSDPGTTLPSSVENKATVPEDGKDSISSSTHTSTITGTINKQGQLVSGSDATYIDYTVYLNAGDIIKNLKTPANFTDTLPDTLELQGDVTVKQYNVKGQEVGSATATVNGQTISYTTPTGQYYYIITYRTKVIDSKLPLGGTVTIKNDGKSTGGIDGSSSSEITVENHKLTKVLKSGSTSKDENDKLIRSSNWVSNVAVNGDLEGYVYEDYSSLANDTTVTCGFVSAMTLVEGSVVVKDASGNTVSSDLYTLEKSTHTTRQWYIDQNYDISDGLFKITFKKGVSGPVTIEYQTTTDISKLTYGYVNNYAELSKDGHTDERQATDTFNLTTNNHGLIIKKQNDGQWDDTSGTTTLNPGQKSIPWVILINRDHKMSSDFTVTDTIKDGLKFLSDTFDISINGNSIKNNEGVTWSFDATTGKLTVNVKESAYRASNQAFTHQSVTISFRTQLPDSFFEGKETETSFKNTASLETDGSITDSTYDQTVIRQVVGKSGSYDKNTHILSYNVVVNPDGSKLNSGNALTVIDTLDAGSIAEYVKLHSLQVFTALKTTDASGNVQIEPGTLVQELTASDSGKEFTYKWDDTKKSFTTYLPDEYGYVIVAKYYVDYDVSQAVFMKNTVQIEGNDSWKKEDNSTSVDQNTSGETHTNRITVVKHDTAQYSKLLSGASFDLYEYKNSAWTKFGSCTTNTDGIGAINNVTKNTLYKLGETQAPNGYLVDEGPLYFIVVDEGTEATAKNNLPNTISGDSDYSLDAVKVYTVKSGSDSYINVEIDRYNSEDKDKTNPGELRVNKTWIDASGKKVTDASNMPEVSVTLTKHVANMGHSITLQKTAGDSFVFVSELNDGAYIYVSGWGIKNNWSAALEGTGLTLEDAGTDSGTPVVKIGPITSDVTLVYDNLYNYSGTFIKQEGGTPAGGTTDTVVGTVTLNEANGWTYLWTDLERGDGITYTITETAVNGYKTSYTINGSELKAGETFSPGESGDKVTITNAAERQYELPKTGGIGITLFTAGGCALLGAALLYGYSLRRRRERRANQEALQTRQNTLCRFGKDPKYK